MTKPIPPVALLVALLAATPAGAEEVLVDGIAAQVGTDVVLISEVAQLAAPVEARMLEAGASPVEIVRMRAQVLERLIERTLIRQLARRGEIDATPGEIDTAIATIAQENGLSPEQLRASVEAQGLPFEAYRERIRDEIVHQKVIGGMVQPRVHLEEQEIEALYRARFANQRDEGEEVHLQHLLVTLDGSTPAARRAACRTVEQALARVRDGADFGEVAAQLSSVNPQGGGDLGWLHVAELADWMVPVVATLAPGEVSEVVETPFGCNLLRLVERRDSRAVSYAEARPALRAALFEQRFAEEYTEFVEKLRGQTFIERKGLFAEAARLGGGAEPAAP